MADNDKALAPLDALERLARAQTPIILADTSDLEWVETLAGRLSQRIGKPAYRWSLGSGLVPLCLNGAANTSLRKTADVIQHLSSAAPAVVVLADMACVLDDDAVRSGLRDLAAASGATAHTLIVPGAAVSLPPDVRSYAVTFDPGLPNPEQLREVLIEEANLWGDRNKRRVQAGREAIDNIVTNLLGLTRTEARSVIRVALSDGILDMDDVSAVIKGKHNMLSQAGTLSFEPHSERLANVAGMGKLKSWLGQRHQPFLDEVPPQGLDRPKGMLLLGVQGGGKSLAAKAVAGSWGVPLLKMDMGALYNKYHGETERNLRESLRAADVMAPCVLWIDEIEKGLAPDDSDGLSRRVLGTLLTWMAERKTRVFLVATANDISALPPELLRKGRFDEIFFVDLPSTAVREDIIHIHLRRREFDTDLFDTTALAEACAGFTGAEIEQAIVSGAYAAVATGDNLNTGLILDAIGATKPLSTLRAESLAALRAWAKTRTVSADSAPETDAADSRLQELSQ